MKLLHRRSATVRIKNGLMPHDWSIVGGPTPTGGYPVECSKCGERREPTCAFDRFQLICQFGCARTGFDGRFQRDDLVVVGDRLDYFVNYLPDGKAATANLGGGTYIEDVTDLRPKFPDR
jgi:hypothetical protein